MEQLGTQLDLVLLHWPSNFDPKDPKPPCAAQGWRHCRAEAWKGLERAYREGQAGGKGHRTRPRKARALGVSNFGLRHLRELLADGPELHVAVNQACSHHASIAISGLQKVELHPWWPQLPLRRPRSVALSPLALPGSVRSSTSS